MSSKRSYNISTERRRLLRNFAPAIYKMLPALFVVSLVSFGILWGRKANESTVPLLTQEGVTVYRFVPGERIIYRLDFSGTSEADLRPLFQEMKSSGTKQMAAASNFVHVFKVAFCGELISTTLERNNDHVLVAYSLRLPTLSFNVDGKEVITPAEMIRTDLSRNIFATVDLHGKVLSVRFDPAIGNLSQNIARTLLATTQFVLPSAPESDLQTWEAQEDNPSGQYLAHYQAESDANKNTPVDSKTSLRAFRKVKARYLQGPRENRPGESELTTAINPEGNMVAQIDLGGGRLVSLNGSESQDTVALDKTTDRYH